jgi:hypothetical protein
MAKQSSRDLKTLMYREAVADHVRHGVYNQFELARLMLKRESIEPGHADYERRLKSEQVRVSRALKWCRGVWREKVAESIQEALSRQLELMWDLYRDVTAEWERSKEDETSVEHEYGIVKKERVPGNEPVGKDEPLYQDDPEADEPVLIGVKRKRHGQCGNPALFARRLEVVEEIARLQGLYPQKDSQVVINNTVVQQQVAMDLEAFKAIRDEADPLRELDMKVRYLCNPGSVNGAGNGTKTD